MKKFIVVIMALITIFSASVVSFGYDILEGAINGSNLDLITNQSFGSRNCTLVYYNSTSPDVTDTDAFGNPFFQKTSYSALSALYDNITVNGVSLAQNFVRDRTYQWYVSGGHCFILINGDRNGVFIQNQLWAGNADGKILYCDAPVSETTYDVVAIAGVSNYFLTNRPAGTTGNGYAGDLYLSYDNWLNIQSTLNNLTGDKSYYTYGHSINGEFRYYLANRPATTTYYVCNSSGQLFYTIKNTGSSTPPSDGGSTFDPTEVITAINSVYDAINTQGSRLSSSLSQLTITANTISDILNLHMNNVVDGFGDIQNSLTTLNGYFSDLSGLFPVQEEITLLGSDTRVAWDSADRITGVKTSGFNTGDLIVKERSGPLVDESGYQNVKLSPDTTEYRLYNDADGYRRIVAANEYPDTGSPIPEGTFCYFSFDDTLTSNVGNLSFNYGGTSSYAPGVNGDAFVFDGRSYLGTDMLGNFLTVENGAFTISFWVYVNGSYTTSNFNYSFQCGVSPSIRAEITKDGTIDYLQTYSNSYKKYTGTKVVPLNSWCHIAVTYSNSTIYCFVNGEVDYTGPVSVSFTTFNNYIRLGADSYMKAGSMVDDFIIINGEALWTSSFNAEDEAVFGAIAKDYFLPCTNQTIGLVFDDTLSKTLTPTDVNGDAITMGRLEDDFSEIYIDITSMQWYCHDPQTQTEILLSSANQQIMNDTIYVRQNYTMLPADQITADALQNLLPVDAPVYLDMPEGAKITITYDHYSGWFRAMYILMDKQNQLLNDLDIVNETIINVENTVVDITQDNDAYNIFYITKTDGTTESVGDAAKDAAVFVGDILSMFYRLVFEDALDSADILNDFESAYSNTEVVVW